MITETKTSPWKFTAEEQPTHGKLVVIQRQGGQVLTGFLRIHPGHKTPTWKTMCGMFKLNDVRAWLEIPKL